MVLCCSYIHVFDVTIPDGTGSACPEFILWVDGRIQRVDDYGAHLINPLILYLPVRDQTIALLGSMFFADSSIIGHTAAESMVSDCSVNIQTLFRTTDSIHAKHSVFALPSRPKIFCVVPNLLHQFPWHARQDAHLLSLN